VPVLSDLAASRELVRDGINGVIADGDPAAVVRKIQQIATRAADVARDLRAWVAAHALFPQAVARFVERLHALQEQH
jgi:hypothetical protein